MTRASVVFQSRNTIWRHFFLLPIILLNILVFAFSSSTIAAFEQSAVNPTTLILPQGPGTISGLGESFTPVLNTGTSHQHFPFILPPGRNGLTPNLALEYNSGFGNGIVGLGRRLSIAFIQRQTNKGLPNYTEPGQADNKDNDHDGQIDEFDEFDTFIDHDGEELVLVAQGLYRSKNTNSFNRYQRLAQGWLITQADGTRLYLGRTEQAQISTNGTHVFAWYLEAYEDTYGNRVEYTYKTLDDSAQIYLFEIRYNDSADGGMAITLDYESRPDILTNYKPGYQVKTAFRLNQITTKVADREIRRYHLHYHPVAHWQSQSLLKKIDVFAGQIQLPSAEYTYTAYHPDQVLITNVPQASRITLDSPDVDFFDMNTDGLADIIGTGLSKDVYWINEGPDAQGVPQWSERQEMSTFSNSKLSDANVNWADVDGNGQVNLTAFHAQGISYFELDEGLSWQYVGRLEGLLLPLNSTVTKLIDINNDKRIDVFKTTQSSSGAVLAHSIQLNLSEGWSQPISLPMPDRSAGVRLSNANVRLADMNGDGLSDLVSIGLNRIVYFPGRGLNGFGDEVVFTNTPRTLYNVGYVRMVDMDRDGRSDLVYLNGTRVEIWLNQGLDSQSHQQARFSEQHTIMPPGGLSVREIRLVDINGNGSIDVVWNSPGRGDNTMVFAELFSGEQPHQLKTFTNGIGKKTTLYYGALSAEMVRDQNAGNPWEHSVPLAVQVVKKIVDEDGIHDQKQIITLNYHNGYYNSTEKTFRGFSASEEIRHGDSTAPALVTAFEYYVGDQNEVLKGKIKSIKTNDTAGNVFWHERQNWEARLLLSGYGDESRDVVFAANTYREQTWLEQGRGSPVTLSWLYDYDDYGNTTRIEESGRTHGQWNDERISLLRYSAESSSANEAWILHLPIEKKITDLTGHLVAKEQWFYDDESFSGNNLGQISKGSLTLRKAWFDPTHDDRFVAAERYRYDQYGNRTNIYGPLWGQASGHHITIAYDEQYQSFPVRETIHTGTHSLTAAAEYDAAFGVITRFTDFNTQITDYTYDDAGRLTAVIKSGDSKEFPTLAYSYQLAQPVEGGTVNWIETRQRENIGAGTIDSHTYFDGFGRTLMVRSEAEQAGQVVVSAQQQFNARGSLHKNYIPYFSQGLAFNPTDRGSEFIAHHYDALGRVLATYQPYTDADNASAYRRISYEPFSQLIEDEEQTRANSLHPGAAKRLIFDGLLNSDGQGRLRQVDEIVGVDKTGERSAITTWSTHYDYDLNGNFTRIRDAQGNVRTMLYDALGRNYFVNDPNRGMYWQAFDAAGNLLATRDAKGQERHYHYDGVSRLLNEFIGVATSSPPKENTVWQPVINLSSLNPVVSYQYDTSSDTNDQFLLGRLAQVIDQSGYTRFSYDSRGRIHQQLRKIQGNGIDTQEYLTQTEFDSANRLSRYYYADGTTVDYHYNARGLLESIPAVVDNLDYTATGGVTRRELANGVNSTWQFDERQRPIQLNSVRDRDNLVLQQLNYRFDSVSNLLDISDGRSVQALQSLVAELQLATTDASELSQHFEYAYDDLYRLTEAGEGLEQYQYRYDPTGNLLSKTDTHWLTNINTTVFRYGNSADNNNVDSWNRQGRGLTDAPGPHALTWADGIIEYDANGNRLYQGAQRYTWDHDNRLLSLESTDTTTHYGYDFENQRRYKVTETHSGSRNEVIYLDNHSELRDGQLVKYIAIGAQRVARSAQQGGVFTPNEYYLHQHLGSTEFSLNAQGDVLNAFTYKPYGDLEQEFGLSQITPYLFTGKERDLESGLGYFHRRYLNSTHGRFLTPDPAFVVPGRFEDPQQWSPYAYGRNNPLKYVDPTGEFAIMATLAVAYAVFEVASTVYDVYDAVNTVTDPNASGVDKGISVGGLVAGAILPGPGAAYKSGAKVAANSGSATITRYGKNHFGIEVKNGNTSLNTHQVRLSDNSTRIVDVNDIPPTNSAVSSVTIPLNNAGGALNHQTRLLNTRNLGPYDRITNSCVSHVCDVLQAGGMSTPPASGSAQSRFVLDLLKDN